MSVLMDGGRKKRKSTFYKKVAAMFGSNLAAYWPLTDGAGAATAVDLVAGRNAAASGVTFLGGTGIDGRGSAALTGSGSLAIAAAVTAALNRDQGTFLAWVRLPAAAWTDGTARYLFKFQLDSANNFFLRKQSGSNNLYVQHTGGGIAQGADMLQINQTGWFLLAASWSKPALNNRIRVLVNGTKYAEKAGSLGNLSAGGFDAAQTLLGLDVSAGSGGWSGELQHAALLSVEAAPAQLRALARSSPVRAGYIGIIGDSISAITGNWTMNIANAAGTLNNIILNHAASSQSIVSHMAAQAAACANDDADTIILQLGTNDNNAGDMGVLQAVVEAGIAALRVSNPRARLFYLNVLPKWTNPGGTTPVAADNTRGAIAAGCAARGVTCWDTFSVPWITASDTSDGTHPNASGAGKIAAQVLTRL